MTGILRLQCGVFVSKFTLDKLEQGQADTVKLPINESKERKAHLTNWISETAIIMNDSLSALLEKDGTTFNLECR